MQEGKRTEGRQDMRYLTMTTGGGYGSPVEAYSDEEAVTAAEALGYEVLDVIEHGGENVLVIA